jgi:hypothetical protein
MPKRLRIQGVAGSGGQSEAEVVSAILQAADLFANRNLFEDYRGLRLLGSLSGQQRCNLRR